MICLSSRLETRFVGETSNSETAVDVDGEYTSKEEGCEEGRTTVEVREWTANGAGPVPHNVESGV